MLLPYPEWTGATHPPAAETHIITVQGHPEFTSTIVERMVNVRAEGAILDAPRAAKARADAYLNHDGRGRIGNAIWRVIMASKGSSGDV